MSKQQVHIFLDSTTFIAAKSQGINVSKVCNELLSEYLQVNDNSPDELALQHDIQIRKDQITKLQDELARLSVLFVHAKETREQQEKKDTIQDKAMLEAVRASRIVEQVFR